MVSTHLQKNGSFIDFLCSISANFSPTISITRYAFTFCLFKYWELFN